MQSRLVSSGPDWCDLEENTQSMPKRARLLRNHFDDPQSLESSPAVPVVSLAFPFSSTRQVFSRNLVVPLHCLLPHRAHGAGVTKMESWKSEPPGGRMLQQAEEPRLRRTPPRRSLRTRSRRRD